MTKKPKKTVTKAVFTAAGLGTRILPATKAIPKEMMPLVDKPIMQYAVEEAKASGIEDIIIITGSGKSAIENHFDTSIELEMHLRKKGNKKLLKEMAEISEFINYVYTRQSKPLGLGHAVNCAANLISDEPFALFLPDDVIDAKTPVLKQMIKVYNKFGGSVIAVQKVPKSETSKYGIIKGNKVGDRVYEITDMVEKPAKNPPSNLAIIGRYILSPTIFKYLKKEKKGSGGEIQLTDAIKELLKTEKVYAFEFEGTRYDAGDKEGFIKATIAYALKRPELKGPIRKFIKEIL